MSLITSLISLEMDYSKFNKSFKPCFSNFSLCFSKEYPGAQQLVLHYNRATRSLWNEFIKLPGEVKSADQKFDSVKIITDCAEASFTCPMEDMYFMTAKSPEPVKCFADPDKMLGDNWIEEKYSKSTIIRGYTKNRDDRDPDPQTAFMLGVKLLKGEFKYRKAGVFIKPDENGEIIAVIVPSVMNVSAKDTKKKLDSAPASFEEARDMLRAWAQYCIGDKLEMPKDARAKDTFLLAVSGLLLNLTKAPGELAGRISSYPSRGGYPTHFLWDSAFQNLGYELMNTDLARDSILQLTENIREDGRIAQFLCSTWQRPKHSQPALTGWAALRYLDWTNCTDKNLMKHLFEALDANNNWWMNQRITKYGLIWCDDGLETGQDNSPRLDSGAILALDMNSYVVNQMRCTAEIGRRIGLSGKAKKWDEAADRLAQKMVDYMYDEEKNFFFDALAETGEKRPLVTSSALIPLWCGVPLPEEKIDAMIREWMICPERLFGKIPFPCVAYDQPEYDPADWWRGPTWMSEAWLLLEVLKKYGFDEEYRIAMERFYEMMIADGQLHELFNSQTGEGMGNPEQGWTAATFIRICYELRK